MALLSRPLLAAGALLVAGCGSIDTPDDGNEPPRPAPPASTAAPSGSGPMPSAEVEAEPESDRKLERTAERLLSGFVGWEPTRKVFVLVSSFEQEGTGKGALASLVTEEVDYEGEEVLCEPGACDPSSAAIVRSTMTWLAKEKLEGIVLFEPVSFGLDKGAPVAVLPGGRLIWRKDHIDSVRGFKITSLPKLDTGKEFTAVPVQAAQSPDGAYALVLFRLDPGDNYKDGFNAHVEPRMYRTP